MARSGRLLSETGIYHVLLRGTNVLFPEDADFSEFCNLLKKYSSTGLIKVFSYALFKNRVHLVVQAKDSIGKALKPLCTSYARYINRTYTREGKLFYDRLKSEPINSDSQLRASVAFVNRLGASAGDAYPYCSLFADNDICTRERLTEAQRKSTILTEMFMEDYDCLLPKELDGLIESLCGVLPEDFEYLSQSDSEVALSKLTEKKWIAKTKLYTILGIKKERRKANTPKATKPPEKKEELSVWLL